MTSHGVVGSFDLFLLLPGMLGLFAAAQDPPATQAAEPARPRTLFSAAHEIKSGPAGPLGAVAFLEQQEPSGEERGMWVDVLATYLCYVGDHRKAMELNSEMYATRGGRQAESDGSELADYKPRPAAQEVVRLAEGSRVVMLNEEHRSSRERAFAHELLEPLHRAGFTHLALETISNPEEVTRRGYPLVKDGTYTSDPILADLVRRAAELGMGIVEYEADFDQMPEAMRSDPVASTNWRERQQAENLARFVEENPEARLLVWSGRHHMSERQEGDGAAAWTPMGGIFKQIAGIDPLTIDLMVMNEMTRPEAEHRTYRWAESQGLLQGPTIFINDEGKPFCHLDSLDAAVFFPRTQWVSGRPDWMKMGGTRITASLDWARFTEEKPAAGSPLVIEVRVKGEADDAVPMDRVIWRDGPAPAIWFRRGIEYVLQLRDPEGEVLASAQIAMP